MTVDYELKQICAYTHIMEFILTFSECLLCIRPFVGPTGKKRQRCDIAFKVFLIQ